jgi:methylenetetrahydrofolate dehydrogenase (NADP+)/methenyltetrahydrofolate cyclohydrolase
MSNEVVVSESKVIDGKKIAQGLKHCLKHKVSELKKQTNQDIKLSVILVGEDSASKIYVGHKQKSCEEVGIKSEVHVLPSTASIKEISGLILKLGEDKSVHGVLLQLPLPGGQDPSSLLLQIPPMKDVDGLHPFNLGMLMAGTPNMVPCTPYGILRALQSLGVNLKSKKALVIGRSRLVGKPIATILLNQDCTVTQAHSKTPQDELVRLVQESDIVVAAIGKANFVKGEWIKEGAIVIDVGMNRDENGKLVGDVEFQAALNKASAITPVPGGVGQLTVAHLLTNTVKAFEMQCFGYTSIEL